MPWAEVTFASKVKTRNYYRQGVRRLTKYKPLAARLVSGVTGEGIAAYIAKRQSDGLAVSSINRELQVLCRAPHLAPEWGMIPSALKIKMLTGEARRERVIQPADGESGCDAWTLVRIAEHSNIAMSSRYVHWFDHAAFAAVERLSGASGQKLLQ